MLRQHPKYFKSKVVRTRDEKVLAGLDIVIDVGSIYDHSKLRCEEALRNFFNPISHSSH